MQSEGSFPEEHRGRRPPPSTSSPCPAWFFRIRSPFFRRSETPVQKRFAPLQLLALVQLAQKRPPDVQPNAPFLSQFIGLSAVVQQLLVIELSGRKVQLKVAMIQTTVEDKQK